MRSATNLLAVVSLFFFGHRAAAFSLIPDPKTGSAEGDLEIAARWSPEPDPFGYGTGFHDGIQVAVASDFGAKLKLTDPADLALLQQVIRQAFEAWETPELHFDVDFSRVPVEGTDPGGDSGWEYDLFAVPASHPAFSDDPYYGITYIHRQKHNGRLITNGQRNDGFVVTGVDIFINVDLVLSFGSLLSHDMQALALQRLLMHEIGHGIGLGHPNTYNTFNNNFDTDTDPFDPMNLNPLSPFAALMYSEQRNPRAIMSNDRTHAGAFVFYTELQYDDRGGRDALYPSLRSCPGDCSGDGRVDVAEVVRAANIAIDDTDTATCVHADRNSDGHVTIEELVQSVLSVLDGCPDAAVEAPPPRLTRGVGQRSPRQPQEGEEVIVRD